MNCHDCGEPHMLYECEDNQYRCYSCKKKFEGLITECTRTEKIVDGVRKSKSYNAKELLKIPHGLRTRLRELAEISTSKIIDTEAGVKYGTTARVIHKDNASALREAVEKLQAYVQENKLPGELKIQLTPEMVEELRQVKEEYTCKKVASMAGIPPLRIYRILSGRLGSLYPLEWDNFKKASGELALIDKRIKLTGKLIEKIKTIKGDRTGKQYGLTIGVHATTVNAWTAGRRDTIRQSQLERILNEHSEINSWHGGSGVTNTSIQLSRSGNARAHDGTTD